MLFQVLEDLIGDDLLSFDDRVREVVEASAVDGLHQRKLARSYEPHRYVAFSVFDCKSETVLTVSILRRWVATTHRYQVLHHVPMPGICRHMDGLAAAGRRLDAYVKSMLNKQVLHNL